MTYVIRWNGFLCGGFQGKDEDDALNAYAASEGYKDFKDLLAKKNMRRDNFSVEHVEGAP